MFKIK